MGSCCSRTTTIDDTSTDLYIPQPPLSSSTLNIRSNEGDVKTKIKNKIKIKRTESLNERNQSDLSNMLGNKNQLSLGQKISTNNAESRGDSANIKKQNEDDNCIIRLVMRIQNEGEFTAPVEEKMESGQARVLDIGCVRGDWVLSNAAKYRWSHFCGIDSLSLSHCYSFPYLSNESTLPPLPSSPPSTPSLPLYRTSLTTSLPSPSILTSPPNTSFIPCHTLFPLPLQNDYFDFVHMSGMGLSIPTNKLDYVVTELIRVTKPGGWIEIAENDLQLANLGTYSERIIEEALSHLTLSLGLSTSPRTNLARTLSSYPQLECIQQSTQKIKLGSVADIEAIRWLDDLCGILMRFSEEIGERLGIGGTGDEGMRKIVEKFRKEVVQYKTAGQRVVFIAKKKNSVKEVAEMKQAFG